MGFILFVMITTIQGGITSQQIAVKDQDESSKVARMIDASKPSASKVDTACIQVSRKAP